MLTAIPLSPVDSAIMPGRVSWIAEIADQVATRFGFLAANLPTVFGPYERQADLAYGAEPQHRLDVYFPRVAAAPRPVIVFWHGGSWKSGDKADYRFVGAALAQQGFAAILPNYRTTRRSRCRGS